jgi:predicted amidophosphoribosyltransferase
MTGFTHCAACGAKLGRVTLFCPRCGRPYCSAACRSAHQARECAGQRPTADVPSRGGAPSHQTATARR